MLFHELSGERVIAASKYVQGEVLFGPRASRPAGIFHNEVMLTRGEGRYRFAGVTEKGLLIGAKAVSAESGLEIMATHLREGDDVRSPDVARVALGEGLELVGGGGVETGNAVVTFSTKTKAYEAMRIRLGTGTLSVFERGKWAAADIFARENDLPRTPVGVLGVGHGAVVIFSLQERLGEENS